MPDFYEYRNPELEDRIRHEDDVRRQLLGYHIPTRTATKEELDELVERDGGFWYGVSRWVSAEEYKLWQIDW